MSKLFVDQVDPKTATTLTLGTSGDTISIPSGVTIANAGTATGFGISSANTPMFAVKMNANQVPSNGVFTLMTFDTEEVDTDNAFTNTASNYKFTVPSGKAGKYFIYAFTLINGNSNNNLIEGALAIYKNGSSAVESIQNVRNSRVRYSTQYASHIFDLSVGDYIQVYALGDTDDGSLKFNSGVNSAFGGYKLT